MNCKNKYGCWTMKIRLNEIPEAGRAYQFDRETAELDQDLEDLIGQRDYDVDLFIKPIGNAYELRGQVKTAVGEVCSKCGWDFDFAITKPIREILFEEHEEHRKAHSVHGNQSVDFSDQTLSMVPVRGDVFNVGAFVHEAIALSEPFYPMCGGGEICLRENEVAEIRRKLEAEWERAEAEEKHRGNPAFAVLQNLDVGQKN